MNISLNKKRTVCALLVLFTFGFSESLFSLGRITTSVNVYVSPAINKSKSAKYVILPVEMKAAWLQTPENAKRKQMFEDRNYEKIEMALLNTGANVLERSRIDKIMKEQGFSQSGLTEENGKKIGKLLNADFVVFCMVIDFGVIGTNAITEVSIKAISIEDGAVVWKAMLSGKIEETTDDFSNSAMETQAYNEFTEKLMDKMKK